LHLKNSEKIIFVPFIYGFGGVERLILTISHFLYEKKISHVIVSFKCTINLQSYAYWPINHKNLSCWRFSLCEAFTLNNYLKKMYLNGSPPALLFDLKGTFYSGFFPKINYHIHLTDPPSLLQSDISKFANSIKDCYGNLTFEKRNLKKIIFSEVVHRINKRGASRAISVNVMTNSIADEIKKIYRIKPNVFYPGVKKLSKIDNTLFKESLVKFKILSISRIESSKRIDWILKALFSIENSFDFINVKIDWHMNIIGDGSKLEMLKKMAKDYKIDKKITFHGQITDSEVEKIMSETDLFIMPAKQGYGLPALEALARGIPVIIHKGSGVIETLNESDYVSIIENGISDLINAIVKMINKYNSNNFDKNTMPEIPSEHEWANNICKICNWI
jgi:glycosyltransferase involved in cell wall biosynthesis